jgi:hypothetical protein
MVVPPPFGGPPLAEPAVPESGVEPEPHAVSEPTSTVNKQARRLWFTGEPAVISPAPARAIIVMES